MDTFVHSQVKYLYFSHSISWGYL